MYEHRAGFDEDSRIEVEVGDVEDRRALADEDVVREPAVQVNVVVREQTVDVRAPDVLLVQVEHRDVRVVLEDHAGDDLVADLEVLARAVLLDDFAGALVPERNGNHAEGVALELVRVRAAHAAAFNLDQNVVVPHFGNRIFLDVEVFELGEHRDLRGLRNRSARRGTGRSRGVRGSARHVRKDFLDDFVDIDRIDIHVLFSFI